MSNKMTSYERSLKHKVDIAALRALLKLKIITDGFAEGLEALQRTNKKGGVA